MTAKQIVAVQKTLRPCLRCGVAATLTWHGQESHRSPKAWWQVVCRNPELGGGCGAVFLAAFRGKEGPREAAEYWNRKSQ